MKAVKTVYVGLSGGVDSSVAAALLKRQGFRVVGVYMQNWTRNVGGVECPWKADLADAKAVAAKLDIAFKLFDFQSAYKQRVVDYLLAEYRAGRTPNPDVMCNQEIKFKLFLEASLADGADAVATGHYARAKDGRLYAGVDPAKDQSYFLYRVSPEALNKSLMPIGEHTKPQVRRLARELGLSTAAKPDSQGICFVGKVGLKQFLRQYVKATPGPVIRLTDGALLGHHEGAIFYTIGQRHGLGIGGGRPLFVAAKDMSTNTVYVADDPQAKELQSRQFLITQAHWIGGEPELAGSYRVRLRHRAPLIPCHLELFGDSYAVKLAQPQRAVSPGQSAVIYDGEQVLGGGIIGGSATAEVDIRQTHKKTLVS